MHSARPRLGAGVCASGNAVRNPSRLHTVVHSPPMTCAEFRASYTEYRDGLIAEPGEERRFERHLATCPSCRKYDTTVRRAVLALQATETVEPSADFRRRLDRRLKRERFLAGPALPARVGIFAALFVAVAFALVAL